MRQFWRNYSLSIVLALLFLASWAAQAMVQVGIEGEAWGAFWAEVLANWQSEYLQLFSFVVLTAYLQHKGSHESKDSSDRMEAKIDTLQKSIDMLRFRIYGRTLDEDEE